MPDTGAPWNIPYVAGTDLVRDWPTDSQELAEAIADGLDAANIGIGTNVVQTVKKDTFSTSSTSFTDITGLAVTITPTSATAKVLLIAQVAWGATAAVSAGFGLQITGGNAGNYIGDAGTGQSRVIFQSYAQATYEFDRSLESMVAVYLDSPATTSATTYQLQTKTGTGTAHVNRSGDDIASSSFGRGASSITAIEVAA